jgi:hypothetical protein
MTTLGLFGRLLICFFISFSVFARGAGEYSEATDVFELMDHVTRWSDTLTPVYRNAWVKKFPLTLEDKSMFSQYAAIRKGEYEKSPQSKGQGSDIFGEFPKGYDAFSEAFYSSKSVGEALRKLSKRGVSSVQVKFLSSFYQKYQKNITSFLKESTHFSVKLLDLNKQWKNSAIEKSIKKAVPFILGKEGRKVKIILRPVWWPANVPPVVDVRGPYLILRYHPLAHTTKWGITNMAKKAVMAILQAQPKNQRSNLTKVFETQCRGREIELQSALYTLFGEMMPRLYKEKKDFNLYQNWGPSTFVDVYLKLLFPLLQEELKGRNPFAGRFMTVASKLCRKIHRLAVVP